MLRYTHLWEVIKKSVKERKFSSAARQGLFIMLLGICCPIFWYALFTGASAQELKFHATHSSIVAGIGLIIMIVGLKKIL
jgi:phosphoglycerol transferase MdoB-like AlkP superfamily enzyme